MHDVARRTRIAHGSTGACRWELAVRAVRPDLRPYIRDYCGYVEEAPGLVRRLEYPGPQIVVIIELGPPVRVYGAGQVRTSARYPGGFVAGLDDQFTLVEHTGVQRGLQLNLTPVGGRLFFDRPMSELTRRVVSLADLLGHKDRHLAEQLDALPDWDARFDLVEDLVTARLARARVAMSPILWAWREIERRGGVVDVRALSRELGYSQKHLITLSRDRLGFPPKLLARIVRFNRLMASLRAGADESWADLAVRFGYYDQSHLVRDVRQFTGRTPTAARASLTALGSILDDDRRGPQLD
jgi:AraC-like DNA-binding protein